ncbi:unnamed protein product [Peronospora destructor]|uniref:DNA-directed RNA polymerase III subunit n=1 Tax=Peronospora destructor TaxID=86335 RepID=A0AAV0UDP0_9STRA|nr:unnamed protein product [Peronospora destructor]
MSRGRGHSRVRFGGSRDSMLADIMDETREDLGLSHMQMELLHAEAGASLYPPMQFPYPEALADSDAYLIQKQRILAHKLEESSGAKVAADKAGAAEQEIDDGMMDDVEEDLGDDMNDYTFDYYDSDAVSNDGDEEVSF